MLWLNHLALILQVIKNKKKIINSVPVVEDGAKQEGAVL